MFEDEWSIIFDDEWENRIPNDWKDDEWAKMSNEEREEEYYKMLNGDPYGMSYDEWKEYVLDPKNTDEIPGDDWTAFDWWRFGEVLFENYNEAYSVLENPEDDEED